MSITKNMVVSYQYVLKDEKENLIEPSLPEPSSYIHGYHQIMPMIESALEGKNVKDKVRVFIPYDKAYGKWDEQYVRVLSRDQFVQKDVLQVGMTIYPDENHDLLMKIIKIDGDEITVDANHPLAGVSLVIEIEVLDVRAASQEEIKAKAILSKSLNK